MPILVMSLLIFGAVVAAALAYHQATVIAKDPLIARLRTLRVIRQSASGAAYGPKPPLLIKLIGQLGGFMPAREGSNALRTGLVRAGYRRSDAVVTFLGSKIALAIALPVAWTAVAYALAKPMGDTVLMSFLLAGVGFYAPTVWIAMRQRKRHTEILCALPDALDLMVVCVEAGLGLGAAIQRVGSEIRIASRALSDELNLVNQEMQTGVSRTDSLRHLAERTGVDDIFALVAMLIQTDRLGTSVAASLRAHAESVRTRRRQRAEQMARKASIKLAFPLVFLIFPALLLVILGPAGIQLFKALAASR